MAAAEGRMTKRSRTTSRSRASATPASPGVQARRLAGALGALAKGLPNPWDESTDYFHPFAGSEAKSHVELNMAAHQRWTLDGERDARILSMALQIRLREVLREDLGGVYGVRVGARLVREPTQRRELTIGFGCDPENVDKLRTAAIAEVRAVARTGVGPDQLTKLTEQLRREREVSLKNNRWWIATLRDAYYFHDDLAQLLDLDAVIARVTRANLRAAAARFLDENNLVIGVLRPASAPDTAVPAVAPSPVEDRAISR
jgi:hypothetical protein